MNAHGHTVPKTDEAVHLFQTIYSDLQSTGGDVRRRHRCDTLQHPLPAAMESLLDSVPHDLPLAATFSIVKSSTLYSVHCVTSEVYSLDSKECCDTNCFVTIRSLFCVKYYMYRVHVYSILNSVRNR
jgi:hypothetical protein